MNLIVGIAILAIIVLFLVIGGLKGLLRTILSFLFSALMCFVAAAGLAFVLPGLLEDTFSISGEIIGALEGEADLIGTLTDELFMGLGIVDLVEIFAYFVVLLIVLRAIVWPLLKTITFRIFRGVKSRTVDVVGGAAIWGAIGIAIAVGIIILLAVLYGAGIEVGDFCLNTSFLDELFGADANGLFTTIYDFIVGLEIGFLNDLIVIS